MTAVGPLRHEAGGAAGASGGDGLRISGRDLRPPELAPKRVALVSGNMD